MNKFKEIIRINKENPGESIYQGIILISIALYISDWFGKNVMEESLTTIWGSKRFRKLRNVMKNGRNFPFCVECDVMDAGERERTIKKIMKENNIK